MEKRIKTNTGAVVFGVILILVGLVAIVGQFLGARFWNYAWPGFILVPGLLMFVGMLLGGKQAGGLAIPATILTILGLVLFYQNLFNLWWTWAFIWALVGPVAAGLGIVIFGLYSDNPGARKGGLIVLIIGLALFAIFGFAFGLSNTFAAGFIVPIVLIGVGIYIVIKRTRRVQPPQQ